MSKGTKIVWSMSKGSKIQTEQTTNSMARGIMELKKKTPVNSKDKKEQIIETGIYIH